MATKKPTDPGKTVQRVSLNMADLETLESFDDALNFMVDQGIDVKTVSELQEFLGDGFTYVDKSALVNIPFLIMDVKHSFSPSYEVPMVTVRAMTATNKRVKFTDFGTGIRVSLEAFEGRAKRSAVGIIAHKGLTSSDFTVCDDCGTTNCRDHPEAKQTKASTYYLALDA